MSTGHRSLLCLVLVLIATSCGNASETTATATGDPCDEAEALLLDWQEQADLLQQADTMSDADWEAAELREAERWESVLATFGPEAIAAFDSAELPRDLSDIDSDAEDPLLAVNDLMAEVTTRLDDVTLDRCGWPLAGARRVISEAFWDANWCSIYPSLAEEEPCTVERDGPAELPCFESHEVDDWWLVVGQNWTPVDCTSGLEVAWVSATRTWEPVT